VYLSSAKRSKRAGVRLTDGRLDREDYVLNVVPKTGEKFLYRGKIWVDPKDFAVPRIEAEPAKNPSMWIKKTEINTKRSATFGCPRKTARQFDTPRWPRALVD